MERALLAIGGGRLQLPAIRWAREAGMHVVVTDQNPSAPARRLAHRFETIGGTDVARLVELATDIDATGGLAGAYTSNDFGLHAVAAIGAALGTPAASPQATARALDKAQATMIWREHRIATTTGTLITHERELDAALSHVGYPAILKPADSSGSRGVRSADGRAEALEAYAAAREHSSSVIVEHRLEGQHIDVNAFFREGAFIPAGLLDRFFTPPPVHVPTFGLQPSHLSPAQQDAAYRLVERGARALGIDAGPVKADVVWSDDRPVLLELAPRFHGDVSTAHVTPLSMGRSPIQAWFATLAGTGGPFDELPHTHTSMAGWMAIMPATAGALVEVHGVDAARAAPGVTDVLIHRAPGYSIPTLGDNRAVCGFLWATGRDRNEVEQRLRAARELLRIEVEMSWPSAA